MHLPGPLRAAVGLVATAADEAKSLPDRAVELPMLAVSTALQLSLRAQQRYARLTARGDDVLNRQEPGDAPPEWATFDDPLSAEDLHRRALAQLGDMVDEFEQAADSDQEVPGGDRGPRFEDIFGASESALVIDEPTADHTDDSTDSTAGPGEPERDDTATVTPISVARAARKSSRKSPRKAAAKKAPAAKKTTAAKTPAAKTPAAKKTAPAAKKAPAKKVPAAKKTTATKSPAAKKTAETTQPDNAKPINAPRHTAPSKFDDAGD